MPTRIPKPINPPPTNLVRARSEAPRPAPAVIPPSTNTAASNQATGTGSHHGTSAFSTPVAGAHHAQPPSHAVGFTQGAAPAMGPNKKDVPALDMEKASCLTHGMSPEFVDSALRGKQLRSAYNRLGPEAKYSRPADKNGGGALAVYTRAVGTEQKAWPAKGHGVGSNDDKVQMILSPEVLTRPNHSWRASSTDNMGLVPGATKHDQAKLAKDGNPLQRTKPLWGKQSEASRNDNFNRTVAGTESKEQNEQLHWQKVPLTNNLKGMVCTSQASFDKMMQLEGAKPSGLKLPTGIAGLGSVPMGGQRIPVTLVDGNTPLVTALRASGIANSQGQVR